MRETNCFVVECYWDKDEK